MEQLLSILSDVFQGIKDVTPEIFNQTVHAYVVRETASLQVAFTTFWAGLCMLVVFLITFIPGLRLYENNGDWKEPAGFSLIAFGISIGVIGPCCFLCASGYYISNYSTVQALNAEPVGTLILKLSGK